MKQIATVVGGVFCLAACGDGDPEAVDAAAVIDAAPAVPDARTCVSPFASPDSYSDEEIFRAVAENEVELSFSFAIDGVSAPDIDNEVPENYYLSANIRITFFGDSPSGYVQWYDDGEHIGIMGVCGNVVDCESLLSVPFGITMIFPEPIVAFGVEHDGPLTVEAFEREADRRTVSEAATFSNEGLGFLGVRGHKGISRVDLKSLEGGKVLRVLTQKCDF